jgi:large subunit ribosomal protein L31e
MAKLERIYTVPLGDAYDVARNKRVPRAVKIIRTFIARHMKADGERILLSGALNEFLWQRSIQKPPRRVKVRLVKDDGAIKAFLADEKAEEPKKDAKKEAPKEAKKEAPKPEAKKPEQKKEEKAPAEAKK